MFNKLLHECGVRVALVCFVRKVYHWLWVCLAGNLLYITLTTVLAIFVQQASSVFRLGCLLPARTRIKLLRFSMP